jgi:hypothetical protein
MSWKSLSNRFSSIPLVLVGPIVRVTTASSVSEWIAIKELSVSELTFYRSNFWYNPRNWIHLNNYIWFAN